MFLKQSGVKVKVHMDLSGWNGAAIPARALAHHIFCRTLTSQNSWNVVWAVALFNVLVRRLKSNFSVICVQMGDGE